MRKPIYLMLIILMPIFAQKSKWKIAESKQIVVPEKMLVRLIQLQYLGEFLIKVF